MLEVNFKKNEIAAQFLQNVKCSIIHTEANFYYFAKNYPSSLRFTSSEDVYFIPAKFLTNFKNRRHPAELTCMLWARQFFFVDFVTSFGS